VAQSYIRAAHWYREAADGGHAAAQNNLGLLCEYGKGVEASDADALQWYYAAALQGNARAQSNLAYFYAHGRGLPQSTIDAQVWYERAAAQGDETAIKALKRLIQDS
jgi:TPR repeat protein